MGRSNDLFRHAQNKNLRLEPRGTVGRRLDALRHRLGPAYAALCDPVFTERVIEYPFVFRELPAPPARVLDFGSYEDLLPLHLAALGYSVVAQDLRGYPFADSRISVVTSDIFDCVGDGDGLDAVVSVSTIEHVGLASSGGRTVDDGDARAVELLLSALTPGGLLIATVPFGAAATTEHFRVYDRARLAQTFPDAATTVYAKNRPSGHWAVADPATAERVVYGGGYAPVQAVACVTCRVSPRRAESGQRVP